MNHFLLISSFCLLTSALAAQALGPASNYRGCDYNGVTYGEGARVKMGAHYYRCSNGAWQNDDAPLSVSLLGMAEPVPGCSAGGVEYGEGARVKIGDHYYRCTNGNWQNDDAPLANLLLTMPGR